MKFNHARFAEAVQSSGISVQDLAAEAGISRVMVYGYMSGANTPGSEALASLSKPLGHVMEHFFCDECPVDSTEAPSHDLPA